MTELFRSDVMVKSIDETARTVDYIASTESVDSYGEIVEQDWILDRFEKNPVILFCHNKHADGGWMGMPFDPAMMLPIGRAVEWGVVANGNGPALRIKVQFSTADLNPFADQVFRNVIGGFLKGGSVGFSPHDVRRETHEEVDRYILSKNELYEFSVCPIGANPDAVALSIGDKSKHLERLKSLSEGQRMNKPQETPAPVPVELTPAPVVPTQSAEAQATSEILAKAAEYELRATAAETALAAANTELATSRKLAAETVVDAMIGKTIVPVAKVHWVALRLLDAKLFDSISESLPQLNLTERVIGDPPVDGEAPLSADSADARVAARFRA